MILNLIFADAAKKDAGGTMSALGLGIAAVGVASFPLDYDACAVMVVTGDEETGNVAGQEVEVVLEVQTAEGVWEAMATGTVRFGTPPGPSLFGVKFSTRVDKPHTRRFRLRSGDQVANASIRFHLNGAEPARQGGQ